MPPVLMDGIATKILGAELERPWQVLRSTFTDPDHVPTTGSRAMVLALLVLEAVRNASHYEGLSEILIPDAHLAELLRERRSTRVKFATPAGQILRRILQETKPRFKFCLSDAQRRATSNPE